VPLWRYLSRARLGEKDTAELERSLKSVDRTAWPAPVLDLFLGQAKPDAVRAAAAEGDAAGRADRDCEASFYLGEFALLDGRREDALGLLRQAGDQCPAGFTERAAARGEAARLAK
jgi:lipoprotein NlpI